MDEVLGEREELEDGAVVRISATVEQSLRELDLEARLAKAEQELAALRAQASTAVVAQRRTIPAATQEMLAKHGMGEGAVDVQKLDAALAGLSLEQRIAVKTQLLRAGAMA